MKGIYTTSIISYRYGSGRQSFIEIRADQAALASFVPPEAAVWQSASRTKVVVCWVGKPMLDDEKDVPGENEIPVKATWTAPVLIDCGTMTNVLHLSGMAGDGTATGSQFS